MSLPVRVERDAEVAVVVIDNPPVNAGSAQVRAGLLAAIETLSADPTVAAVVLIGAGNSFIAGSDLKEFGQPLQEPQLPQVIAAIERCPKPVVAALHGAALGGGYELALGCDSRIAAPGTVLGLPEVSLGIIPGAGGTQRLPRLIGIPEALRIICSASRVPAEQALALGMIDAIVDGDLRQAALAHARLARGKAALRDRPLPVCSAAQLAAASVDALRAGRQRPAVKAAIAAVSNAALMEIDQGLSSERAAFEQLRGSREARALRHVFFAERASARHPHLLGVAPRQVDVIAVLGAGTMGSGIAIAALDAGYGVLLLEQDGAALERGTASIQNYYAKRVETGKLASQDAARRLLKLEHSVDWKRLVVADLVIEAVFEDMAVKQQVFAALDGIMRPGTVLASNTSYLDLDAIAGATARPQDVLGLHFFGPANVMRLLEVVRGSATAPEVLATGLAVAKRLGKLPILTANAFGFIGNRIYAAYRRQCEFMLEEGAYPEQVDAALEAFGFAMGPFAVADMSGLDIAWRMRQSQAASRDPRARYVHIPDRLCAAGRLGRKTGAGYYRYEADANGRQTDPLVHALIEQARADQGMLARSLSEAEIQRRALLAMVNEAALLLEQGVAERCGDVDLVLINGYGFPRWQGGPVFWARERGGSALAQDLDWLAELSGPGFVRGDLQQLLRNEA